jgi:hypothetical protein
VTQERIVATGKYGGHPPALAAELAPSDHVHAAVDGSQLAGRPSMPDSLQADAVSEQLPTRHHPVLSGDEDPDL